VPGHRVNALCTGSFLRRVDPRTKMVLAAGASTAVALPLVPLAIVAAALAGLLVAGRLADVAMAQLWRVRLWFCVLFAVDWCFIGFNFAVLIVLRLVVLAAAFTVVFATTTADELCLAGERLGLPWRVAFAVATAFRALALVEREWCEIIEAQRARGISIAASDGAWRRWRQTLRDAAALVVPAIVLAVQRAWAISEAAAARGFDSPVRRSSRTLRLQLLDHALLAAAVVVLGGSLLWR
jgi:energy-coupling factor transporter transmembrane protein EcfT